MQNELKEPTRFNGKCKRCGLKASFLAESRIRTNNPYQQYLFTNANGKEMRSYSNDTSIIILAHECPAIKKTNYIFLKQVLGRVVMDKLCDGRCMAATGNQCECSCGGKNHGAGHSC
jgi:hypothetical protein